MDLRFGEESVDGKLTQTIYGHWRKTRVPLRFYNRHGFQWTGTKQLEADCEYPLY